MNGRFRLPRAPKQTIPFRPTIAKIGPRECLLFGELAHVLVHPHLRQNPISRSLGFARGS